MLGAYVSPKKYNPMLIEQLKSPKRIKYKPSLMRIFCIFPMNNNKKSVGITKRKNAKRVGEILSRDHLKIGGPAPQIVFATMSAITAFLYVDITSIIEVFGEVVQEGVSLVFQLLVL